MDIQNLLSGLASSGALNQAASGAGLSPDEAHGAVAGVLEHMCSGGGAEEVATVVASKTGLDPAQVQAFLPQVLPLLEGHAANTSGGTQSALTGLIGQLGGFLNVHA
jgi:hypothetical protein